MKTTGGLLFSPPFTTKNYTDIIGTSAVFGWMLNSLIVATGQTLLTLAISTLAGYGFARTDFPGKKIVFVLVLAGLAVPEQAIIVPLHHDVRGGRPAQHLHRPGRCRGSQCRSACS